MSDPISEYLTYSRPSSSRFPGKRAWNEWATELSSCADCRGASLQDRFATVFWTTSRVTQHKKPRALFTAAKLINILLACKQQRVDYKIVFEYRSRQPERLSGATKNFKGVNLLVVLYAVALLPDLTIYSLWHVATHVLNYCTVFEELFEISIFITVCYRSSDFAVLQLKRPEFYVPQHIL